MFSTSSKNLHIEFLMTLSAVTHLCELCQPTPNKKNVLQKRYFSLFCTNLISLFHACIDFHFQSAKRECSISNSNFTKNSTYFDQKSVTWLQKISNFTNILQNNVFMQGNRTFKNISSHKIFYEN